MIWLDGKKLFGFTVEKQEIPRPMGKPYYPLEKQTGVGVLHTTEGSSVAGAMAALKSATSPPHFCVGEGRVIQCRPIGVQGGALHSPANQTAYCQIEIVGHSQQTPWLPPDTSLLPLIAVVAYATQNFGIPNRVPCTWPDDCSDLKGQIWAANNSRRRTASKGAWNSEKGWWMHLEVPNQGPSWHWDCGAMRRSEILRRAQVLIDSTKED